jgi:hypothetical protein
MGFLRLLFLVNIVNSFVNFNLLHFGDWLV